MIAGCAQQSDYSLAFQLFQDNMLQLRLETNVVTFLCLILAGSRGGLLYEGLLHLNSMQGHHHITPMLEHYNLLVDLLGQKGYLNEVEDLLETIPFQHNAIGWTSLLSSCKHHVNLNVARWCFDRCIMLEKENVVGYVLLSSIYANVGPTQEVILFTSCMILTT